MGCHPKNTHGDGKQVPRIRWSSLRHRSQTRKVARKPERWGIKSSQISKNVESANN